MSTYSYLIDSFRLEAQCAHDHVVHTTTRRDRASNHKIRVDQRWDNVEQIGHGAMGQVVLQTLGEKKRAVKKIYKQQVEYYGIDYKRELDALATFSSPLVRKLHF